MESHLILEGSKEWFTEGATTCAPLFQASFDMSYKLILPFL